MLLSRKYGNTSLLECRASVRPAAKIVVLSCQVVANELPKMPPVVCANLYDAECRILWSSWASPGVDDFIGQHPWSYVSGDDRDRVQAAFLRALTLREFVRFDASWDTIGRWQTRLFPCEIGPVRLVAYGEQIPMQLSLLTPRQIEIARLTAAYFTVPQIARTLDIARSTVDVQRSNAAKRLEIPSQCFDTWAGAHSRFL